MLNQKSPSVDDVRRDPFCLDALDLKTLKARPRIIVTNEPFQPIMKEISVEYITPPLFSLFRRVCARIPPASSLLDWIADLIAAVRLVLAVRLPGAVGLVGLGNRSGAIFCFFNSFKWFRGGPVVVYRLLLPARAGRLKTYLIRRALGNAAVNAVWSRSQIQNYHRVFGCPLDKLVFVPYKANHSKAASNPMPVGDYIFSGGNSERDYKTLFEAVRGLSIPVIVSTTKPALIRGLSVPENVILVSTEKVAFERLMAGCRMLALCVKGDIIRAAGEPTMLNAMWHGKPVVVADNISASDYIEDGVDGFIVPAGSAEQMRRRILEVWHDPVLAARLGEAGRRKVNSLYTHYQWKARMQALAMLVFECERLT